MNATECWEFLQEPRIGVLTFSQGHDAPPHATPLWFWVDGSAVMMTAAGSSRKARALRDRRPAGLMVQHEPWPSRYVYVQGSAQVVRERTHHDLQQVATRYLGPMLGAAYAERVTHAGVIIALSIDKVHGVRYR